MHMADHNDFTKLEKHPALLDLLKNLERSLGPGAFQVVDHWQGDSDAIGVAHPLNRKLLAYIAAHGSDDFYIELELPPQPGSELPYSVAGEFQSLSFDQAAVIVAEHFANGNQGIWG